MIGLDLNLIRKEQGELSYLFQILLNVFISFISLYENKQIL